MPLSPHDFLTGLYDAALKAAMPAHSVPRYLPNPPKGRTIVVGAGKAAASMAKAVEDYYEGTIDSGLVVTRYQHGLPLKKIEVVEAGHPKPDDAGRLAAQRVLDMAKSAGQDDLLLCLISGGGSALLTLPAPDIGMNDMKEINGALLLSGANIHEINCVRKHLSAISGGRLAKAANGARVVSLIISDVTGDDLSVIASGPTVEDPTTFADARDILARYGIKPPAAVERHLAEAAEETVKLGDPCLDRVENILIASSQEALEASAAFARKQGVTPYILGNAIEGETKDVALVMAAMTKQVVGYGQPFKAPCVLISGGETTVTVKGNGVGGRNGEFALRFAMAMQGMDRVHAISCGTDGSDGSGDNAGAIVHPDTLAKALAKGAKAMDYAANNDSYGFFKLCEGLVHTGPTLTNVNDIRAIYIAD